MTTNTPSTAGKRSDWPEAAAAPASRPRARVPVPFERLQLTGKRLMDVVVSAIALAIASPVLAVASLAIKATSPGPVFFLWPVVGVRGRPLRAYKLRTMIVGADAVKAQLREQNESTGPMFKMRHDPRVTSVGRILRKYSLDELPQLWSVLKGDMSLVGPRPVLTYEWAEFDPISRRKLDVKPGMISLWHVRGQPRDFDEWMRLDFEYIDHWSLWLDLTILARGAAYLFGGKNY
jgi:lipopolysaccharide/colanic/teichoic acid biosynthesis glycosyltransferase